MRYATPGTVSAKEWESISGRDDPQQRFRLYRLCACFDCSGTGKVKIAAKKPAAKCESCRGEGKVRELVATAPDEAGVGTAIIELGREGEWLDCPVGLLDTQGEVGKKWLIVPWLPSARNTTDAGRVLALARHSGNSAKISET